MTRKRVAISIGAALLALIVALIFIFAPVDVHDRSGAPLPPPDGTETETARAPGSPPSETTEESTDPGATRGETTSAPAPEEEVEKKEEDPRVLLRGRAVITLLDGTTEGAPGARLVVHEPPVTKNMTTGKYENIHTEIQCDGEGRFEAMVPPNAVVFLQSSSSDRTYVFPPTQTLVNVLTDPATLEQEVEVRMLRRFRASGIVLDPAGDPVEGALVTFAVKIVGPDYAHTAPDLGDARATTEANGHFVLEGLPPARTLVAVGKKMPFLKSFSSPFKSDGAEDIKNLEIRLAPGASILGIVQDELGDPIAGATIRITTGNSTHWVGDRVPANLPEGTVTGQDGRYRLEGLLPQTYEVFASHPDFVPDQIEDILAAFDGATAPPMVLRRGGTFRGIIVDEQGAPLAGVQTSLAGPNESGGQAVSGEDGRFEIRPVLHGNHKLYVGREGFIPVEPHTVLLPHEVDYKVTMKKGQQLAGIVLDYESKPVDGARVEFAMMEEGECVWIGFVNTDSQGRFRKTGVPPGAYKLKVRAPGLVFPDLPEAPAGTTNLEFRAVRSASIGGRVTGPKGEPLFKVRVTVVANGLPEPRSTGDGRYPQRAFTAADGTFRFDGLLGEAFELQVQNTATLTAEPTRGIPANTLDVELRMRSR